LATKQFAYLWRAIDHEGEVLEACVTKRRDRKTSLKFRKEEFKKIRKDKDKQYRSIISRKIYNMALFKDFYQN
jgi:transposase-like protein|tara:strand:- start:2455 stop:2673 length:219 start_codon:yes stop_codon:yes gene_type:complete